MDSGLRLSGGPRVGGPGAGPSLAGVIFDFNGVLWWDGHLQDRAWGEFSARLRGDPLTPEEMELQVHGRYNRDTFEYLLGRPLDAAELARLTEEKEQIYRGLCLAERGCHSRGDGGHHHGDGGHPHGGGYGFRLSPGAVELLDHLVAQGMPRTIATASGRGNVDFFVAHLALDRWFDPERIVYDDGTLPGKPAPDLYLRAARALGQPPARCLVVEDSRAGIEAARRAGIGYVVALGPSPQHDDLRRLPGVDQVVESLQELLQ